MRFSKDAIDLGVRGFWVAPLQPRGKAPVTANGIRDSVNTTREIWDYWRRYPSANIAIDLHKSGLLGIGPDSPQWLARFQELGLPETLTARSGGGEGHRHFYYRRPEGCLIFRINRSGEYDLQSDGYFVAPPSIHPDGPAYTWLTPLVYPGDLPEAPAWAVKMLEERVRERPAPAPRQVAASGGGPPVRLTGRALEWWEGSRYAALGDGGVDRSRTLFIIGLVLAGANATESAIAQALAERDITLGYWKYADRRDGQIRYSDIARKAMEFRFGGRTGDAA
jgi:hypothetical protein